MTFSQVIGNDELKAALAQMVDSGRLSHAILLCDEDGGSGFAMALALAQYVNCRKHTGDDSCGVCPSCHKYEKLIHPDLHFVFPVNKSDDLDKSELKSPISDYFLEKFRKLAIENPYFKEAELYEALNIDERSCGISVAEAHKIAEKLSLRSFEGEYKTMIVFLPERMNAEAANKLLKTLEEPAPGTLFILVSKKPERLLQTIRSRCQAIQLKPLTKEERSIVSHAGPSDSDFAELLTKLLKAGMEKRIIDTFEIWETLASRNKEQQKSFCIYAEKCIRDLFLTANNLQTLADSDDDGLLSLASGIKPSFYEKATDLFDRTLSAIENNGNPKLVFCNLCNRILLYL